MRVRSESGERVAPWLAPCPLSIRVTALLDRLDFGGYLVSDEDPVRGDIYSSVVTTMETA